jgi:hypothetical protein
MAETRLEPVHDGLLTAQQLAEKLGVHLATLYRNGWWMGRRVRVGGAVRFDPRDYDLYVALMKGAPAPSRSRRQRVA